MIDADKLFKDNSKEAFDAFFANKKIIPITDNLIKLDNIVYELDEYDMHRLLDYRCAWGYTADYDGYEKNEGDAAAINGLYHSAVSMIVDIIHDENAGQTTEKTTHKIVAKIVNCPSHKCNVLLGNHSAFRSNIATVKKFDYLRNPYSFWRVHDTTIV